MGQMEVSALEAAQFFSFPLCEFGGGVHRLNEVPLYEYASFWCEL